MEWADAVKVLNDRRTIAYSSLTRVEAGAGPLLGGTLAAIALSFDRNGSLLDLGVVVLYFIPLSRLVSIYLPRRSEQVPDATSFNQKYELAPKSEMRRIAYALGESLDNAETGLSSITEAKAESVRAAVRWLFGVTIFMVLARLIEAIVLAYALAPEPLKTMIAPRASLSMSSTSVPSPTSSRAPRTARATAPPITSPKPRDHVGP